MKISMGHREVVVVPSGAGGTDFDITKVQDWRLHLTSVTGTFLYGERVVQAGTLAEGIVFSWNERTPYKTLKLVEMAGTFNTTGVITGQTSGAVGTPLEVKYAFPNGIRLSGIDFKSSAANDVLVVRHDNNVGSIIFDRKDTSSAGGIHQAVGGRSLRVKPYIYVSECTFSNATLVKVRFEYD